ncbi:MAG: tetratricopeptide repeat protein [Pirellulaceae bacterium]|nr:tetratricopeptide repeat protein [Planctomycetales bacterium]
MQESWDRYWFGPVSAIRPYLFHKFFLLLIAIDIVVLMTVRGARYGVDGFSVSHFSWMQMVHPLPLSFWYVGTLMCTAFVALMQFFLGGRRWQRCLLVLLYTYAWSMSRHDSYSHHYMVSLILSAMVFFPQTSAAEIYDAAGKRCEASTPKRSRRQRKNTSSILVQFGQHTPTMMTVWAAGIWLIVLAYRVPRRWNTGWVALAVFLLVLTLLYRAFWRRRPLPSLPKTSSFGFRLLGATVGVIYLFTSLAKVDAEWCGGHTIQQVGRVSAVLGPVAGWGESMLGLPAETFWVIVATLVIPVELTISISYFLAVQQDEPGRRRLRVWCIVAYVIAMGLHCNNEMMELSIQWFSYYMMFLATFFFLPENVLWRIGSVIVWPAIVWRSSFNRISDQMMASKKNNATLISLIAALVVLLVLTRIADIPGTQWSLPLCGLTVIVSSVRLRRSTPRVAMRRICGLVAAGTVLAVLFLSSSVRFSYFNLLGLTEQKILEHEGFEVPQVVGSESTHMERSLVAFHRALSYVDPSDPRAANPMVNIGLAFSRMNKLDEAVAAYGRAVEFHPHHFLVHYNLGITYLRQADAHPDRHEHFEELALASFHRSLRIKSDLSDAMVWIGRIYLKRGEGPAAITYLQAAKEIEPGSDDVEQLLQAATQVPTESTP